MSVREVSPRRGFRATLTLLLSQSSIYIVLIVASAVFVLPFVLMASTSFKDTFSMFAYPPEWIPKNPTLANYIAVFRDYPYLRWGFNTFFVAGAVTGVKLVIDSMAGYAFAKREFFAKEVLFILVLATLMVPFAVTMIPSYFIIRSTGLFDSYPGLILPALANPIGIFMMRQFISTIPSELEDAARIDGAGEFGIFWRMIMPLSLPALAVLAIFTFMLQWTMFLWPLLVTSSLDMRTLTVGIAVMKGHFTVSWGVVMAASLVAVIPMLVLFLFFQRYFIKGLTLGALKG